MDLSRNLTADRIGAGERLVSTVESTICDACQDECWLLEVYVYGDAGGEQYKTCLRYVPHIRQSQALAMLGKVLAAAGAQIRRDEERAWLLEHQLTIL